MCLPGKYVCLIRTNDEGCTTISIVHEQYVYDVSDTSFDVVGFAGVDSGLLGFFAPDKPDYDDMQWRRLCDWMYSDEHRDGQDTYLGMESPYPVEAFWGSCDDGQYDFESAVNSDDQQVAFQITFAAHICNTKNEFVP